MMYEDSCFDDFQRKQTVFSIFIETYGDLSQRRFSFQADQLTDDKYHYATILRKGRQTCMYDQKSHDQLRKEGFTMCTTRVYVPIVQCRLKLSQKNTKRELLTLSTICIAFSAANSIPFLTKGEINRRPEIFWKQAQAEYCINHGRPPLRPKAPPPYPKENPIAAPSQTNKKDSKSTIPKP